jgi:hypothetical protein
MECIQMACRARTENGARCRNTATESGFCALPRHSGGSAELAPPPTTVLFKARINGFWTSRLVAQGVRWQGRDDSAFHRRHAEEAKELRRSPTAYRTTPDSGTPVFGGDGAPDVTVKGLCAHLEGTGYQITDIHLYQRPQDLERNMANVVIELRQSEERVEHVPGELEVLELLEQSTWGFAHVGVKPPQEDGHCTHTINLVHRSPDKLPRFSLSFSAGDWELLGS